jgi:hypothetical protein
LLSGIDASFSGTTASVVYALAYTSSEEMIIELIAANVGDSRAVVGTLQAWAPRSVIRVVTVRDRPTGGQGGLDWHGHHA